MAYPSVTYTFSNATTASATEVNQNFTDLINGMSDGTKDFSISALTVAGTATLNGAVNLGNATGDDITVNGYVASNVIPKTDNTYDLGTSALAWKDGYFDGSVYSDTISELTADAGVTIDGLLLKDGTFSGSSIVTAFDNATATQLGYKQYLHGTTYNGGNAPTVTCAQAGFAVARAVFVPYQSQDGTWRLRGNIAATFTSASVGSITITVNGITSKNTTNFYQTINGFWLGSGASANGYINIGASTIVCTTSEAVAKTSSGCGFCFDIELNGKPTWAY